MDFPYGETEIAYLRARDLKLGAAMDRIGPIHREVDPDLFSSVIHHIIGQQVSMAAQRTVWQRLQAAAGTLVPETVAAMPAEALQALGMTRRRALYILEFARKVASGDFDLDALAEMEDREVLARLTSLRGVGPWTAEMLLIFGVRRPDVVSWGDLAILRGMRMLYRKRSIDQRTFQRLQKRYSPYGTTASLYLWAIACGALPELKEALEVELDGRREVMEVAQHVGGDTVRCIMLSPSEGLGRGMAVTATGAPISVPVARACWAACSTFWATPSTGRARCRPARSGRFTASPPRLKTSAPWWTSSRPASRSSTCWPPTPKAERSACSAAPAWARRCSSRS